MREFSGCGIHSARCCHESVPFLRLDPGQGRRIRHQRGYGGVNQAMSFGVPLVCAGLTEDKADVNMRVGWSDVEINLETNKPTP